MRGSAELGFVYAASWGRYEAHRVLAGSEVVRRDLSLAAAADWLSDPSGLWFMVTHNSSPKPLRRFKHALSKL